MPRLIHSLKLSSIKAKVIQCEEDIKNLKEALTETKEDERKKDEQLQERAVRINFFFVQRK